MLVLPKLEGIEYLGYLANTLLLRGLNVNDLTEAETRMARLILQCLDIDDVDWNEINPNAPLFDPTVNSSLGLDSIDALEISLAIATEYGVQLEADNEDNKEIFFSLRSLTKYIATECSD